MTETQLEARQERADNGALVVSKLDDGYRVYSVHNPSRFYLVRHEGERLTCTCPDFEVHQADTTWRCKHILAVAPWQRPETAQTTPERGLATEPEGQSARGIPPAHGKERFRKQGNGGAQMLIKRSVSPDGRIDSVSVEFSMPVAEIPHGEIKAKALATLKLQKEIVADFLKLNGEKPAAPLPPKPPEPAPQNGQPPFARMIDIGKVNGKWGERLCLNVQVNGRTARLFGSAKQLAEQIQSAGYAIGPEHIEAGLRLDLACHAVTKPSSDGRYLNVEKVLPIGRNASEGGADDRNIPY